MTIIAYFFTKLFRKVLVYTAKYIIILCCTVIKMQMQVHFAKSSGTFFYHFLLFIQNNVVAIAMISQRLKYKF